MTTEFIFPPVTYSETEIVKWRELITGCVNDLTGASGGSSGGGTPTGTVGTKTISQVALTVAESGGDDVYNVEWFPGTDVSDASHSVVAVFFKNGTYAGQATENSPATSTALSYTAIGAADSTADFHHVILMLKDSVGTIYTQVAEATSTAINARLLESGDFRLLESGDYRLLE